MGNRKGLQMARGYVTPVPKPPHGFSQVGGLSSEHVQGRLEVFASSELSPECLHTEQGLRLPDR